MPVDRFVSATLVSVDARNRVVEVWNGGNPAPLLVNKNGEIMREWVSNNLPLGILPGDSFSGRPDVFHYEEDCQLCMFSDGFPEAESPRNGAFGKEQICKILQGSSPGDRLGNLVDMLDLHLDGQPAHDDVSLAMVEIQIHRRPEAAPAVHAHAQT